jgi:hypothetical protein
MRILWGRSIGDNIRFNQMLLTKKNSQGQPVTYTIVEDGPGCYPWTETFVWWPWLTTISGDRIFWKKIYKRRVWVVWGTGFHMHSEVQYATLFEILEAE